MAQDRLKQGPGPTDQTILLGGSYGDEISPAVYNAYNNSNIPFSHFGFRIILVGDVRSSSKILSSERSRIEKSGVGD
jgi:hypothetical protein